MAPLDDLRGHRLVVRGWIRTAGVVRGEGAHLTLAARERFDFAASRTEAIRGDTDWSEVEAAIDVPIAVESVTVGATLNGNGTAWFDDLEIQMGPAVTARSPGRVVGKVVGPDGEGEPGAVVMLATSKGIFLPSTSTTDAGGEFEFESHPPGKYMLTATSNVGIGRVDDVDVPFGATTTVKLEVRRAAHRVAGRVIDLDGAPYPGLPVGITGLISAAYRDVYYGLTRADGTVTVPVPYHTRYHAIAGPARMMPETHDINHDERFEIQLYRPKTPVPAVVEWIRTHNVPLATTRPGGGFEDLSPLADRLGAARVVGLGEATHGTREFFQIKHRFVEWLVVRHGFNVFAIEANRTESRALNRYVLHGEGDPKAALRGIYFWIWNTEEVLELLEWMREYNQGHTRKVMFVGIDMQASRVAAFQVREYLRRVAPTDAAIGALNVLAAPWGRQAWAELGSQDRSARQAALETLERRFNARRSAWIESTSRQEWADAREDLVLVRQALGMDAAKFRGPNAARDRAMADNVLHAMRRAGDDAKVMLWAHNVHVSRAHPAFKTMGVNLADALGRDYVVVGFAFDRGEFQARDAKDPDVLPVRAIRVGGVPDGHLEATLRQAGIDRFFLPLYAAPKHGAVAEWLSRPVAMRNVGAGFGVDLHESLVVGDAFDVLVFVAETTRARPLLEE